MSAALHRFAAAPTRLDPATGIFTGYASLFGIPDAQNDVVERGPSRPRCSGAGRGASGCSGSTIRPSPSAPG